MQTDIDILENEILKQYPEVLEILLRDHTTQKNIFWATDNYENLGKDYHFDAQILPELITGENGSIIMPRVQKDKLLQQARSKDMAEVFTPSWICNAQNNPESIRDIKESNFSNAHGKNYKNYRYF